MTTSLSDRATGLSAPVGVVTSDGATWTWDEMFHEFAPAIFSYARSWGVSNADDIVQEVFRSVVEKPPRIPCDRLEMRSLLFTIAYRRIVDVHRSFERRRETLVAEYPQMAGQDPAADEIVTNRETASEAMQALTILSERERRVIEMRFVQEASPADVAEALGVSNGNVRVIQARALTKIRRHLGSRTPSWSLVFGLLEALRGRLPSNRRVGRWISDIGSDASEEPVHATSLGVGASGSAGVVVATAGSFASSGLTMGSALAVGLVVSLAIASAVGATVLDRPTTTDASEAVPAIAQVQAGSAPFDMPSRDTSETSTSRLDSAPAVAMGQAPNEVDRPRVVERPAPSETTLEAEEKSGPPEASENAVEPIVGAVVAETGETVESIDAGVLQPIVDDVVAPLIEDAVQPLIEDLFEPVLTETSDLVVEDVVSQAIDTVESVVEGVIEPIVETPTRRRLG